MMRSMLAAAALALCAALPATAQDFGDVRLRILSGLAPKLTT